MDGTAAQGIQARASQEGEAPASGASILIVDDTLENLRLLSEMLGARGFDVRPVTSGAQALQAAMRDRPDLVLLDVNMPEMNGYETCERFRANPALQDVVIIFLTALSDAADKVRAFAAGGVDFISKPFQLEEVLARVKTHLDLSRTRRELAASLARLQALERLRDDLVHMMVHDMRSPLTTLAGHLELLKPDVEAKLGEQAANGLGAALRSAHALTRMANDLIDVRKMEEGALVLARTTSDLRAVAAEVRDMFAALKVKRPIVLAEGQPVRSSLDESLIKRVVENLVNNAIKHTSSNGRVELSVSTTGTRARVEVTDEGPGVPESARERIFEKFGNLPTGASRDYHSAGLGLAFCKMVVDAHGGSIGVTCPPTGGSVFWFELPA